MIRLQIRDKATLHDCYMPFIENGGLFIANHTSYRLGDEVAIQLTLMDETEVIPVQGRVVWVAGTGVKHPHSSGVGIQFNDPAQRLKNKIETYLADSSGQTATM